MSKYYNKKRNFRGSYRKQTRQAKIANRKMAKENTALKTCLCITLAGIIAVGTFFMVKHVTALPDTPKQEITDTTTNNSVTPSEPSQVGSMGYANEQFIIGEI